MSAPKLSVESPQLSAEEGRSPLHTSRSDDSVSITIDEKKPTKTVGELLPRFRLTNPWLESAFKTAKVQEARGRRTRKQKKRKTIKKKRSTRHK
jgi:hypothetical protein